MALRYSGPAHLTMVRAMHERKAFTRSNMSGVVGKVSATGRLPQGSVEHYKGSEVAYTVLSYQTPIAWVTTDGKVVIPDEYYSVSTSGQQKMCREYL